jgi:cobalt/nickel transport system permease protein
MHVPDGFLPGAVLVGGYAVTGLVTAYSLRKINQQEDPRAAIPKAALLTAAFFIASAIRVPVPPVSIHLLLSGLMGVILGWYAFPSIVVGLILQFLVFGHGGITTLGVNAVIMGIPAMVAFFIFRIAYTRPNASSRWFALWGFVAGASGVVLAVGIFYTVIITTLPADIDADLERTATIALSLAHLPLALVEGLFTALLVSYLRRVKPELIEGNFGRKSTAPNTASHQQQFKTPPQRTTMPRRTIRTPAPASDQSRVGLDQYAHLDSPVHRWTMTTKLIGLIVLMFTFAIVTSPWLLVPMIIVTALIFHLSKLPLPFLRSRLQTPGFFILFLVVLLPFITGSTPLITVGPLTIYVEGLSSAILLAVRFICILTLTVILFGTDTFLNAIRAMRALKFPDTLADITLLTYRYIFEVGNTFAQLRVAVRLRGFRNNRFSLQTISVLASLLGNMLVRSYEQSDRVYKAMILRGYGAGPVSLSEFDVSRNDILKLVTMLAVATAFVVGQFAVGSLL